MEAGLEPGICTLEGGWSTLESLSLELVVSHFCYLVLIQSKGSLTNGVVLLMQGT
jgi:hypothetical protein